MCINGELTSRKFGLKLDFFSNFQSNQVPSVFTKLACTSLFHAFTIYFTLNACIRPFKSSENILNTSGNDVFHQKTRKRFLSNMEKNIMGLILKISWIFFRKKNFFLHQHDSVIAALKLNKTYYSLHLCDVYEKIKKLVLIFFPCFYFYLWIFIVRKQLK